MCIYREIQHWFKNRFAAHVSQLKGDKVDTDNVTSKLPIVAARYAFENLKLISSYYWERWDREAPYWAKDFHGGPQVQYTVYPVDDLIGRFVGVRLTESHISKYRWTVVCYGNFTEATLAEEKSWHEHQVAVSILHTDVCEIRVSKTYLGTRVYAHIIFDGNFEVVGYKLLESEYVAAIDSWFNLVEEVTLDKQGSLAKPREFREGSAIPFCETYDVVGLMQQMLEAPVTEPIDWSFLEN